MDLTKDPRQSFDILLLAEWRTSKWPQAPECIYCRIVLSLFCPEQHLFHVMSDLCLGFFLGYHMLLRSFTFMPHDFWSKTSMQLRQTFGKISKGTWNPLCTHTHLLMFPMAGTFLHLLGKRLLLLKVAALMFGHWAPCCMSCSPWGWAHWTLFQFLWVSANWCLMWGTPSRAATWLPQSWRSSRQNLHLFQPVAVKRHLTSCVHDGDG